MKTVDTEARGPLMLTQCFHRKYYVTHSRSTFTAQIDMKRSWLNQLRQKMSVFESQRYKPV